MRLQAAYISEGELARIGEVGRLQGVAHTLRLVRGGRNGH